MPSLSTALQKRNWNPATSLSHHHYNQPLSRHHLDSRDKLLNESSCCHSFSTLQNGLQPQYPTLNINQITSLPFPNHPKVFQHIRTWFAQSPGSAPLSASSLHSSILQKGPLSLLGALASGTSAAWNGLYICSTGSLVSYVMFLLFTSLAIVYIPLECKFYKRRNLIYPFKYCIPSA